MAPRTLFECDSCGYEVSGYLKRELEDEGWKWFQFKKGQEFAMCDSCSAHYEKRWARPARGSA